MRVLPWIAALCLLAGTGVVPAEDSAIPEDPQARLSALTRSVEDYSLTLQTSPARKLDLHPKPILRFDNQVGGVVDGVVMLWTDAGRPAALGQVFVIKSGLWLHEFQSAASNPLVLDRPNQQSPWHPRKPGIEFQDVPKAPLPAETRGGRLIQMKEIARRFSASDDFRQRAGDPVTTKYELRLLPSPAYRYPENTSVTDGALFAFVHGTDPEVVLILEAEQKRWRFAAAPLTCWAVHVSCDNAQVWSCEEQFQKSSPEGIYHIWGFDPR